MGGTTSKKRLWWRLWRESLFNNAKRHDPICRGRSLPDGTQCLACTCSFSCASAGTRTCARRNAAAPTHSCGMIRHEFLRLPTSASPYIRSTVALVSAATSATYDRAKVSQCARCCATEDAMLVSARVPACARLCWQRRRCHADWSPDGSVETAFLSPNRLCLSFAPSVRCSGLCRRPLPMPREVTAPSDTAARAAGSQGCLR